MFRLLKLKPPPNGWTAVAWELAIVTLGVLIALAAQELVSDLNDRRLAAKTRGEISKEIEDNLASIRLRQIADPCVERRLSELRAIVADWSRTGTFNTPSWVSQAPKIEVKFARLEASMSAGRLALLSGEEQYRIGAVVEVIRRFEKLQDEERLSWGRLRALQAGPDDLSPAALQSIRTALQDASTRNYEINVAAQQVLPLAADYGFRPDFRPFLATAARTWAGGKFSPSICHAIDTPPERANKSVVVPLPL